ncbi:hypothetical protein A2415_03700 [candidate division WWE3 bacterium RIFOXYC1_FULL_39_7]|uniref:Lactamase n=2 Tax=Katanobacteria TaxID=422282 RepID=A0A1F4X7M3_UNCKA|nr:MAG: hypothetical protein A2415_03700 [candidate division WWE3 bacterium RIFOXYC1_FULL_39_7]OGC77710.1 MAG: hypothetical protein A2619_03325 [candidate division WWE3 bacterium RIFOXYD1_FULL_39_9]
MEITFVGHSCFKIKGKDLNIVIDPYDSQIGYKLPKMDADVVLVSHDHFDHNGAAGVSGYKLLVNTAGEYEVSDVIINGIQTFHDDKNGSERGSNIIYSIDIDGINLLHLGDLGHELSDSVIEKLGTVDVLMIPVGGTYTIDAETAAKVISSIEPSVVIPMHYQTPDLKGIELGSLDKFLDEMGVENNIKKLDKFKLNSKSELPDDTEIVVLSPSH